VGKKREEKKYRWEKRGSKAERVGKRV
jgi:hypothetical protein